MVGTFQRVQTLLEGLNKGKGMKPFLLCGSVEILHTPDDYFDRILQGIRQAKESITLSALYIGTGPRSQELIQELQIALEREPNLQVVIVIDHGRAMRERAEGGLADQIPPGEGNQKTKSAKVVSELLPLLQASPQRVKVYFFQASIVSHSGQTPLLRLQHRCLSWLVTQKPILSELLGVYHAKFCIFDSLCLLSGANLSDDYFTSRQDRYWLVDGSDSRKGNRRNTSEASDAEGEEASTGVRSDALVSFLYDFLAVLQPHCHRLTPRGSIQPPSLKGAHEDVYAQLQQLSLRYSAARCASDGGATGDESERTHTVAYPLLQLGSACWNGEYPFLPRLLQALSETSKHSLRLAGGTLASPYPAFTSFLSSAVGMYAGRLHRHSASAFGLLVPSKQAHGFGDARGLKSLVPPMHESTLQSALSNASLEASSLSSSSDALQLERYCRSNWTFHAKGLWLAVTDKNLGDEHSNKPGADGKHGSSVSISYIGSSNFGGRSAVRDLELGFLVVTCEPQLKTALLREREALKQYCVVQTKQPVLKGYQRVLSKVLRSFL